MDVFLAAPSKSPRFGEPMATSSCLARETWPFCTRSWAAMPLRSSSLLADCLFCAPVGMEFLADDNNSRHLPLTKSSPLAASSSRPTLPVPWTLCINILGTSAKSFQARSSTNSSPSPSARWRSTNATLKLFRNRPDKHKQICGTRTLSQRYKSLHVQTVPAMKVQTKKKRRKKKEKKRKKKKNGNIMRWL